MRIIDDKGRIFGKLNIIDFLVVVFLFCLVPMFYLGSKIMMAKKHVNTFGKAQIEVKFSSIMPELAGVLAEGDIIKDPEGREAGVLKKIISIKPSEVFAMNLANVKDNNYLFITNSSQEDVLALFVVDYVEQKGSLYFNTNILKVGSNITVTSDLYILQGIIVGIKK